MGVDTRERKALLVMDCREYQEHTGSSGSDAIDRNYDNLTKQVRSRGRYKMAERSNKIAKRESKGNGTS